MKKKFLALVLTLAMVLSLVPATALATNGTQEGDNQGPVEVTGSDNDNNLTMKKTVTPVPNEDGTYTVRLESYAKGEVTTTTTTEPLDIVLLLDVSGSMDEPFTQSSREYRGVYNGSLERNKTYYVKINNKYKEVKYCSKCNAWTNDCKDRLFSGHKGGKKFIPRVSEDDTDVTHAQFYEYVYTEGQSKMGALKQAVNKFIDDIAKNSPESKASIVKFAGKQSDAVGDSKYSEGWYEYNYTQIVQNLTQVNSSGAEQLKRAVSNLEAAGATSSDYGLEKAKAVLDSESATQKKVIILFTDGEPNHDSGFDYEVATNAVNTAKTLKQNNTTIYTVGVFKNPSDDINQYMSSVSSNHPNATAKYTPGENWWDNGAWTVTGGDSDFGTYYKTADSADKLIEAFQKISSEVSSTHLDASAVVVDNVPSNFALTEGSVKVYTENCIAKNGETFEWGTKTESTIRPTINDQSISVTGFNFSKNWCGLDENNQACGQKLIIEFTISRTNYGGTQPTNGGAYIKAKEADEKEIIKLNDPTVPVTISLGIPEAELNEKLGVSSQKEYDGSGIPILSELSAKANDLVDGINNAYVDMELTIAVDEANTYVYRIQAGKQSGDWYQNDQKVTSEVVNDVKTSQDVKRGQNNAVEPYIYNFDLKLSDATPKGAAPAEYKDNIASFKITPRNVTLTSATDSKEYDGTPLTNHNITVGGEDFAQGEGATYTVTGSQTELGESDNRFTYTLKDGTTASNYNITLVFGTLTITEKEEVSYTVIFNANGGAWDDGNETVPQTYESSSSLVSRPTNDPTKSGSTFVDWAYKDAEGTFHSIGQNPFMGIRVSMLQQLSGVTGNSVTLYAVWKDNDTAPTGSLNYRINQYFIDETGEVANSISKPGRNTVGTAISALISDLVPQDRNFPNYRYEEAETKVNNEEYTDSKKLTQNDTVINLYYYLDSWKDGDTDPDNTTDDSLTDGDGIPDYKQILIQYQVYQEGNGLVTPEFEVVTVKDNKELTAIHGSSVTKAGTGYTFVTWTGQNVAVTEKTVGDIIDKTSAEKLKKEKCDLSKDTFEQGKSYTYTAIFLEDKIGGGDNKDQPDGIPDRYQVTINYVSSDTSKGSVGTLTKEVLTIYENGKEGKWASKGKVVASGSAATATGSRCYFSNWTNDAGLATSYNATLGQQTIEKAEGGKTYTFTANFGRSSSGGHGGGTVTIPDDVPTGLNGKDHYAYVVGYPDGMVYPQKNITRAEVATIFFRLLTDETREANMTKSNSYNDMKDGAWYTCAVSTLSKMGIIKGYEDGSFKPDASISRAEFAAIAARFDPDGDKTPATFSDVSSHWAKDEISIAANHGWIKGYEDGSFKPDQKITRAETMTLVNRVLKRLPETKDDLHKDMKTWPDNQNESAWFYLAVQEATNSHYQKLKKDGTHETWESMRETRDWAALEK